MDSISLLQRPVMKFLLQHHDLEMLQVAMKQALRYVTFLVVNVVKMFFFFYRKATCRVYAMQALNWLLRSVTQPVCLHDLLWWFVTSLTPIEVDVESDDDNKSMRKIEDQVRLKLVHHFRIVYFIYIFINLQFYLLYLKRNLVCNNYLYS